jgi:hypothetical protein
VVEHSRAAISSKTFQTGLGSVWQVNELTSFTGVLDAFEGSGCQAHVLRMS